MRKYIFRRLLLYAPTLFLASIAIFLIMRVLPGDVALVILGGGDNTTNLSMEQLEQVREQLGLKDPLYQQYAAWAWSMVNGDFGGDSIISKEPLAEIVGRRLPVTLQLTLYTAFIAWAIAIPAGLIAALYQNRPADYLVRIITVSGNALPNFWIALMLILGLLLYFNWTPPLFYENLWENPKDHLLKMIWPALVLSWGYAAYLTRVTRSTMLEVFRQDYMRTARSKGMMERVVILRHGLPNTLIPVITMGGLQLASLLSGTVVIETVFSLPGIGQGVVQAAGERDYPVIQSLTMLLVAFALTLNVIIDVIYAKVDPRISYA